MPTVTRTCDDQLRHPLDRKGWKSCDEAQNDGVRARRRCPVRTHGPADHDLRTGLVTWLRLLVSDDRGSWPSIRLHLLGMGSTDRSTVRIREGVRVLRFVRSALQLDVASHKAI